MLETCDIVREYAAQRGISASIYKDGAEAGEFLRMGGNPDVRYYRNRW